MKTSAKTPIETDAVIVGAGPVGLFQVFELGLLEIKAHVIDSLAAVGGPAAVMEYLAPLGPVYQAGTLSGNPLATAAGLTVLGELDAAAYARLERTAARLADGMTAAFARAQVTAQVVRVGTLVGWFLAAEPVRDYDGARAADHDGYARIFHGLLDRGVSTAPSGYEAMFPSLAHTDEDIDAVVAALEAALADRA